MLPPVIEAMLSPAFYPHPARSIHLVQTHASYVVLTGPLAYKVKKPVDFGFLDYSTLEKRRRFITEELRLNRRFAPELYLGQAAVVPRDEGFGLVEVPEGQAVPGAVEYALRMRQFDQAGELDQRLAAGSVSSELVEALARRVAEAHAAAPAHAVAGQARVRTVVEGNFTAAARFAGDLFDAATLERMREATDRFFAERGALFDARAAAGWFRECHGDLHARNIATVDGALVPFDAIEFNDTYRIIDVLADAAFLTMDLAAFGRDDLANRFLNAYLEAAGAWEGADALALYLAYRAFVRAKINALTAADEQVAPADRVDCRRWAGQYFALAARYTERLGAVGPRLTILFGLSGSGKSTRARQIALETGALHIRSDAVRKHLAGRPLQGSDAANAPLGLYGDAMTADTYARMLTLAEAGLRAGFPVVLDARYALRRQRDAARALAARLDVSFAVETCTAPRDELVRRLRARRHDISDATEAILDRQLAETEPLDPDER